MDAREIDESDEEAYDPAPDERLLQLQLGDPNYVAATEKDISDRLKRGRVIRAKRAGDHEALARLATTEELRRLAYRRLRDAGATKANRDRVIYQDRLKSSLEEASYDVERIREIWQQHYGRRNRKAEPTAIEIAARRHGMQGS